MAWYVQTALALFFSAFFLWFILRKKILSVAGGWSAVVLGLSVWLGAGWTWLLPLFFFFLSGTLLARLNRQSLAAADAQQGNPRNAWQVWCNGGIYAAIAIGLIWFPQARHLLLVSMAVATADTWSSEIGMYFRQPTLDILRWRRVPVGLSGGVSWPGSLGGLVGAGCVGILGWVVFPGYDVGKFVLITVMGFVGMILDSLLGAAVQARYLSESNELTDKPNTRLAGGISWVSNDVVNLLSNALMVLFAWLL
ncbi:MAG: DUF92 domain-containing protein [Lewinellaceae bacterium]|nr:DUF92 domain-containing protein [Lewinellaceae bacterium]